MSFATSVRIDPQHISTEDATPLAFNSSVYDKAADLDRNYIMRYYPETRELEIFDVKNQRLFLKKQRFDDFNVKDFRPGNAVVIYGRQHNILGYANDFTRTKLQNDFQTTFGVIKPGEMLLEKFAAACEALASNNLYFSKVEMSYIDESTSRQLYSQFQGEQFYEELVESLVGKAIFFEISGFDCREKWRKIIGNKDPKQAEKGSLREQFGKDIINNVFMAFKTDEEALQAGDILLRLRPCCNGAVNNTRFAANVAYDKKCDTSVVVIYGRNLEYSAKILHFLEQKLSQGLQITGMHAAIPTAADVGELLASYNGVIPQWQDYCDYLSEGMCLAIEVSGQDAVASVRKIAGPFDVEVARVVEPESIRAVFGTKGSDNAVFVTDIEEESQIHSDFWFNVLE